MKKTIAIMLVLTLALAVFAGCAAKDQTSTGTPTNNAPVVGEGIVKLGLGVITSIGKSKSLDGDVLPLGQVDSVIVAAAFDKDGKVVKVVIDNAQTKVNFDKDLQVTSDLTAAYKTKVELGDDYGMIRASTIKKEWYQQIAELEKWMVGKTMDEIKAMKVKQVDDAHPSVPDVAELTSLVTITIQDYIAGLQKAYDNAVVVNAGEAMLGLGNSIAINKSKSLDGDVLPLAQVDTVIAATLFDNDGKVVGVIIDSAQTKVAFDKDGAVTSDKTAAIKTKVELGDDYGMARASSIKKEWHQQIAALETWMTGKTVAEIKAMKVTDDAKPDDAELTSSVTMTVSYYLDAVSEAFDNKK